MAAITKRIKSKFTKSLKYFLYGVYCVVNHNSDEIVKINGNKIKDDKGKYIRGTLIYFGSSLKWWDRIKGLINGGGVYNVESAKYALEDFEYPTSYYLIGEFKSPINKPTRFLNEFLIILNNSGCNHTEDDLFLLNNRNIGICYKDSQYKSDITIPNKLKLIKKTLAKKDKVLGTDITPKPMLDKIPTNLESPATLKAVVIFMYAAYTIAKRHIFYGTAERGGTVSLTAICSGEFKTRVYNYAKENLKSGEVVTKTRVSELVDSLIKQPNNYRNVLDRKIKIIHKSSHHPKPKKTDDYKDRLILAAYYSTIQQNLSNILNLHSNRIAESADKVSISSNLKNDGIGCQVFYGRTNINDSVIEDIYNVEIVDMDIEESINNFNDKFQSASK